MRCFFEPGALNTDGSLTVEKSLAVNKIGHALHTLEPVFQKFSLSAKFGELARAVGLQDPRVCQSMYLFKQPRIGGSVDAHQDATFLRTEPDSVIGLWFALERATIENCLLYTSPSPRDRTRSRMPSSA